MYQSHSIPLVSRLFFTLVLLGSQPVRAETVATGAGTPAELIPPRLTLERAVELGRTRGYDVALAEAAVADARANRIIARELANPVLSGWFGKSFNPYGGPCIDCAYPVWGVEISDQATLSDVLFGKRHLRDMAARAGVDAAVRSRDDALRTLTAAIEYQYVAAAVADRSRSLTLAIAARVGRTADLVRVRFRAGDVSQADVLRAETEQLRVRQQVEQQAADLLVAKARLAVLLGVRTDVPPFEVDTSILDRVAPAVLAAIPAERLLRVALAQRPDYRALDAQLRQAERTVDVERRNRVPPVTLSVSYGQQGWGRHAISPPTVTVNAALPLPILNQNQGAIAKAQAGVQTARLSRAYLEAQIAGEVAAARAHLLSAVKRLARQSELVDRTLQTLDLVELQYEKGAASLIDLLDTERGYVATNQDRVGLLGETWAAVYELRQALGGELPR